MIVVRERGQDWIEGKVIGNASAKVCEIAKRPVLIVPLQTGQGPATPVVKD